MAVPGIDYQVFGGFLSLKLGVYCAGAGTVRLDYFTFQAIDAAGK